MPGGFLIVIHRCAVLRHRSCVARRGLPQPASAGVQSAGLSQQSDVSRMEQRTNESQILFTARWV